MAAVTKKSDELLADNKELEDYLNVCSLANLAHVYKKKHEGSERVEGSEWHARESQLRSPFKSLHLDSLGTAAACPKARMRNGRRKWSFRLTLTSSG
jgi:hypothetical protein